MVSNPTSVKIPSCQGHSLTPLMTSIDEHVLRCILVFGQILLQVLHRVLLLGVRSRDGNFTKICGHQGYITMTASVSMRRGILDSRLDKASHASLIYLLHPNAPRNGCPRKVFVDHCLDLYRLLRKLLWKWGQRCCQLLRHLRGRAHSHNATSRCLGHDH